MIDKFIKRNERMKTTCLSNCYWTSANKGEEQNKYLNVRYKSNIYTIVLVALSTILVEKHTVIVLRSFFGVTCKCKRQRKLIKW